MSSFCNITQTNKEEWSFLPLTINKQMVQVFWKNKSLSNHTINFNKPKLLGFKHL